jgi:hypothetical protein
LSQFVWPRLTRGATQSVRLSKYGIYHVSSGDNPARSNDAMRLNWGLGTPLPDLASL